jgi:hypothetical protein
VDGVTSVGEHSLLNHLIYPNEKLSVNGNGYPRFLLGFLSFRQIFYILPEWEWLILIPNRSTLSAKMSL